MKNVSHENTNHMKAGVVSLISEYALVQEVLPEVEGHFIMIRGQLFQKT